MTRINAWYLRYFMLALLTLQVTPKLCRAQDEDQPLYKTKFRVINVHRHCDSANVKAMEAELEVLSRVGVDKVVILDGRWTDAGLLDWVELRKRFPQRIVLFANINFDLAKKPGFSTAIVRELEVQYRLGVQGIKVTKALGMYYRDGEDKLIAIDDVRLDPFWQRCGELGLPVLIHSADPKEYWSPLTYNSFHYGISGRAKHHQDPKMPTWEALIRQRDNLLKKHPKTKFIGAHMGSQAFELADLAKTFDKYPNFFVDCSARLRILGRLNPKAVRDFFVKYQDRLLFGTDSTALNRVSPDNLDEVQAWRSEAARFYSRHLRYFETGQTDIVEPYGHERHWLRLAGVKLPDEVLRKFYYDNAKRIIPDIEAHDSQLPKGRLDSSPPRPDESSHRDQAPEQRSMPIVVIP